MSPSRGAATLKAPDVAPVFAALGDTTRLGLLRRLSADGPLSITRLSEGTGVTRQAITRHLTPSATLAWCATPAGAASVCSRSSPSASRRQGSTSITSPRSDAAATRLKAFVEK
jgi:DNA-binding transcriptional ArsR family regulator